VRHDQLRLDTAAGCSATAVLVRGAVPSGFRMSTSLLCRSVGGSRGRVTALLGIG
jgi:hypothetical protein